MYLLHGIRYCSEIHVIDHFHNTDSLPDVFEGNAVTWVMNTESNNPQRKKYCTDQKIQYRVINESRLHSFPGHQNSVMEIKSHAKKGHRYWKLRLAAFRHFRFFEEGIRTW